MKCTLVISDWEMRDDFFDFLKDSENGVLIVNDKRCQLDDVRITYQRGTPIMGVNCHALKEPSAN